MHSDCGYLKKCFSFGHLAQKMYVAGKISALRSNCRSDFFGPRTGNLLALYNWINVQL
jgi:hypothetical protein